jgi:hypothetical protein
MPRSEEMPMDPEILAELAVIDQTLAGESVDPEYAELAELSLLLAGERVGPSDEFIRSLDARAARRFAPAAATKAPYSRSNRIQSLFSSPGFRIGLVAAAALALVVIVIPKGGGSSSSSTTFDSGRASLNPAAPLSANHAAASSAPSTAAGGSGTGGPVRASAHGTGAPGLAAGKYTGSAFANSGAATAGAAATTPQASALNQTAATAAPTPNTAGRKVVQSAQVTLATANNRIDAVSQEVFNVVARQNGYVQNSQVTSAHGKGATGQADFTLSIPTANLETTLQELSALPYAHVVQRTDATQDVTGVYRTDQRRLADALALRTSLLKQLANATTQIQIDSLKAQIRYAEAQINSAQRTLGALQHQVNYSSLRVYVSSVPVVVVPVHTAGGFTIGRAVHDAGRVLVVGAGVILIVLAALIPIGLVAALIAWIAYWLRQRRREQALDQS